MGAEGPGGGFSHAKVPLGGERLRPELHGEQKSVKDFPGLSGFFKIPDRANENGVLPAEKARILAEDRGNYSRHILLEWASGESWENISALNRALRTHDNNRGVDFGFFRDRDMPEKEARALFNAIETARPDEKSIAAKALIEAMESRAVLGESLREAA